MTKARYALDVSMAVRERPTGLARFIGELVASLDASPRAAEFVIVVRRGADVVKLPPLKNIPVVTFGFGREILWHQTFFPLYAALHRLTPVSLANTAPLVNVGIVAIHDITYKTCAASYRNLRGKLSMWWHRFQYAWCARFARRVLTVSEFSKTEFVRVYRYPPDRIFVLFNGWEHVKACGEDEGVFARFPAIRKGEYYFVLGNLFEFKNVSLAVRTARRYPETQWVITGTTMKSSAYAAEAAPNVIWTGYLSNAEVKTLTRHAKALYFPSLSEGFGIPPLEALALGTPAIVSRASCLPGVYRNCAHWIDDPTAAEPQNPDELLKTPVDPPDALLAAYSWHRIGTAFLAALDRRKIAAFVPRPLGTGGVGVCLRNYLRHLDPVRFQMDFYVPEKAPADVVAEIAARGGRVFRVPGVANLPKYLWLVIRFLRAGRYDIVHVNMNTLSVFALFAAFLARVPVRFNHAHSASHPQERLRHLVKRILAPFSRLFATHLLACSRVAGEFQFGRRRMERGDVTLVRNAIDLGRYRFDAAVRRELHARYGLVGKTVVGHMGRFVQQKNHASLIRTFHAFAQTHADAVLLLVGDGPLRAAVEHKAAELGLSDRIVCAGSHADGWRYYSAFDVFCLPSIYEGLPLVLVEAQANGLACLTSTDVSREANAAGRVEFLSLAESPETWAKALEAKLATRTDRAAESAAACASLRESGYDITTEAPKLVALYALPAET